MTDELDLLRSFRSDIPAPSTDAWARARSAVALAERTTPSPTSSVNSPRRRSRPSSWHRWRRLGAGAAAVAVLLGLLAGVGVIGDGGGLSRPFTTAWKPATALVPSGTGHATVRHGTWRLLDAVLGGTWQQNDYGPPPGRFSCSTDGTCFVLAGKYPSAQTGAPLLSESLYVSTNDGATWSALALPQGLVPMTPLECSGSQWCATGGTYNGQPVLAVTRDGGHSFTIDPLPGGVGSFSILSCPATGVCMGLVSEGTSSSTSTPLDATLLVTNDGGASFHDESVLSGDSMIDLACSTSTDCTAVGVTDASIGTRSPAGVSAVTTNQGRTWTKGSLPVGLGITRTLSGLSCPDAQHCFVMGYLPMRTSNSTTCSSQNVSTSRGQEVTLPNMSPAAKALSERESKIVEAEAAKQAPRDTTVCSSSRITQFSVIAKSSDGGLTWTLETPPSDVPRPYLGGLACPSATECWAAGQETVPVKLKNGGIDMGTPVLIGTTNGGSTWSKVVFTVPSTAPNDTGQSYLSMGSVTCPTPSACVARGAAAQGSSYDPVYSLVMPGG